MRQEGNDSDFHARLPSHSLIGGQAETAKILRRERKAALSLRFFDLESSLRALPARPRRTKAGGREISGRGFQQKHHNIKKDLFINFDFKPTLKPN